MECGLMRFGALDFLKTVVAKLKEGGKSEEEIKAFQEGVQNYWKQKLVPNFANLDFYTGQSMNPEGMYVIPFANIRFTGQLSQSLIKILAGLSF